MKLHDVSVVVRPGTPEWPGDTPYSCGWTATIARGSPVNLTAITMSPHVGTHADAPLHVHDGWPASEAMPADVFVGRAWLCEAGPGLDWLEVEDIIGLPAEGPVERLLLRTGHGVAEGSFPDAWPTLSVAAVRTLCARGMRLLGVDAPSVDARHSRALEVHHALFGAGGWNIESLDLRDLPLGEYDLLALPLRIEGLDAAPLRAVLRSLR